jgi:hypothetical protein
MKTMRRLLFAAAVSLPVLAQGQNYTIDWFTIDGGGGTSTGGVYLISGTVGQPDAGRLTGGSYVLDGGFWGIVSAVQTAGAPLLNIERIGASVRVFWPLPASGFVLDETSALASPSAAVTWSPVSSPYSTNATQISITVSAPTGMKFYRLRKP